MAKAYANNPDINSARASLRATDENVTIAKAATVPRSPPRPFIQMRVRSA